MENAVQALKMAFSMMLFVLGLGLAMYAFSETRTISDDILYSRDETNYYEYISTKSKNENREVGLETIIPTLYKYYKENYTVVFKQANFDEQGNIVGNVKPLFVYKTTSKFTSTGNDSTGVLLWGEYNWKKYGIEDNDKHKICAFDLDDEIKRKEPWLTGDEAKKNMDAFLYGGIYKSNTGSTVDRNIYYSSKNGNNSVSLNKLGSESSKGFIEQYKDERFIEYVGEYAYNQKNKGQAEGIDDYETEESATTIKVDGETVSLLKDKKKRVITYVLKK